MIQASLQQFQCIKYVDAGFIDSNNLYNPKYINKGRYMCKISHLLI
ncbi:hypothetical protein pb186bvf_014870 [Paramecium bursaria]